MWKYPFLNFSFVIAVLILVAIQHSGRLAAPAAYDETINGDRVRGYFSDNALRAPANFSRAAAFVNDMWRRGMVIKQWLMEYKTSELEIFNAASPAENDLLEARFHVANAEVFTQAMRDSNRAIEELIRAEASLQAVETIIKAPLLPELSTIRQEIAAVEIKEKIPADLSSVPFETIKSNLDHLIGDVRPSKT